MLVGLGIATLATFVVPGLRVSFVAFGLDLLLNVLVAAVTIAVCALLFLRYRDRRDGVALVQTSAFLVLACANSIAVLLTLASVDAAMHGSTVVRGQAPLYVSSVAQLLAASLLVVGLRAALRGAGTGHPWVVAVAPVASLLGVSVLVGLSSAALPPLSLASPEGLPSPGSTLLGSVVRVASAAVFFAAALMSRRLYARSASLGDAYLTLGLVFGGFSQLQMMVAPGGYPGLVSGGDLLRLGFDIALLMGIEAEARATLLFVRQANHDLERLRSAEAHRSTLEERARLARELHDGLSQDLWLAKLKVGRLAGMATLGPDAAELTNEIAGAIDAGLADARQAVIALRWSGDRETRFDEQLASYVDDFADRTGLRAEYVADVPVPKLSPRAEAELLRIAQEALSNVRRHADATVVRVHAAVEADQFRLGVVDNGRGFDPALAGESAFGMLSMRERATLIGGRLTIESQPQNGTRVWVDVPLAGIVATSARAAP